jgi:hypothetical protein
MEFCKVPLLNEALLQPYYSRKGKSDGSFKKILRHFSRKKWRKCREIAQ